MEIAPGSEFLSKAGHAALYANRPREAIEFLTQADPESGWLRGWFFYWGVLAKAHHMLGEHREELAVARRARRLFPNVLSLEVRALAALGRTDEVQALVDQEDGLAVIAAGELLLHGHVDAASRVLDRGIMRDQAWLSTLPPDSTSREIGGGIEGLAYMLLLHGRVDEARVVLERPVGDEWADNPYARSRYIGTLGVIAGMQGDRQRALKISQDLEAQPWRWRSSKRFWQARIAASLGEFDRATAILREAVAEGLTVTRIHFESSLLSLVLRDHPPFQALIRPKG